MRQMAAIVVLSAAAALAAPGTAQASTAHVQTPQSVVCWVNHVHRYNPDVLVLDRTCAFRGHWWTWFHNRIAVVG